MDRYERLRDLAAGIDPLILENVPREVRIGVGSLLAASFILARLLDGAGLPAVARPFEYVGAYWIGIVFLTFLCLLVADLVIISFNLGQRSGPRALTAAVGVALLLSIVAVVQGHRTPEVREHDVTLDGLPAEAEGMTLVLISDLHIGTLVSDAWVAARIDQVRALQPDMLVIAGDLVEGDGATERERALLAPLGYLDLPLGVWGVLGNHEMHGGRETSAELLKRVGVRLLRNKWRTVRSGLVIAGVDDARSHNQDAAAQQRIDQALRNRPKGAATILVSHRPVAVEAAARAGVGLMLAGHTHGGQLWPFSYIVKALNTYLDGRFEVAGMPLIVCRSTGTWGPQMRLWKRSEITRITLKSPAVL